MTVMLVILATIASAQVRLASAPLLRSTWRLAGLVLFSRLRPYLNRSDEKNRHLRGSGGGEGERDGMAGGRTMEVSVHQRETSVASLLELAIGTNVRGSAAVAPATAIAAQLRPCCRCSCC